MSKVGEYWLCKIPDDDVEPTLRPGWIVFVKSDGRRSSWMKDLLPWTRFVGSAAVDAVGAMLCLFQYSFSQVSCTRTDFKDLVHRADVCLDGETLITHRGCGWCFEDMLTKQVCVENWISDRRKRCLLMTF